MIGRLVLPAVLLAALAVPASAGAVIVPGKGMFGIEIGMTDEAGSRRAPRPVGQHHQSGSIETFTPSGP